MSDLLATKLYIPRPRPRLISRPRLTGRLQAGTGRKLTLISAPAGFGKTTLLSEWISQTKGSIAWVSLDEGDNDPARFWAYFIAGIQTLKNDLGKNALAMLQSPQPAPIESILTSLLNEIAAFPEYFSLVLDDYQAVHTRSIHEALLFFIEHMPPHFHLVIASRTDPSLPLARLRGRDQLHEIRSDDLRFSLEEAGEFLNRVMDFHLSAEDIAALETRTEGWIAGLQLAAQSMQGHPDITRFIQAFTGNNRYIVGYLVEEVLSQRPKGSLDFLLRTSILERFCGPLCDAVLEKTNSQASLELLERANLFLLPLDDRHQWYRYHQLFADVLGVRLQQTQPGLIPELHRRAAEWLERNELMGEAFEHALAGQDFHQAARIVEKIAPPTIVNGQIQTALGWLEALPDEWMRSSPNLCLIHSAALMFTNQLEAAEERLQDGERYVESLSGEETVERRTTRGKLAMTWATLVRISGDLESCIAHANRSLELLPESEIFWRASPLVHSASAYLLDGDVSQAREEQAAAACAPARASGNLFTLMRSITNLARLQATRGRLHQAALTYRKALQEAPYSLQLLIGSAAYYFGLASLSYEWNDLEAADRCVQQGIDLVTGTLTADADIITMGYILLARLRKPAATPAGALAALEDLAHLARQRNFTPGMHERISTEQASLRLAQGDLQAAVRWAGTSGLSATDAGLPYPQEPGYLALARVMIARRREQPEDPSLHEVLGLLERLLQAAGAGDRMGSAIEILNLRALALHAAGDFSAARQEGYLRTFIDEGEPLRRLLLDAAGPASTSQADAPDPGYTNRILAAFPPEKTDPDPSPREDLAWKRPPLAESFTGRELEVLRLIAEGASNQEIASTLVIAGPTVKRHISNIFGKLGVGSRTQALAQARKLGLLS